MFTIRKDHSFKITVEIPVPQEDGTFKTESFDGMFEVIGQDEIDTMMTTHLANFDAVLVRRVLKGWDRVKDADGELVPFSDKALDDVLRVPYQRAAISRAYTEVLSGARRKN